MSTFCFALHETLSLFPLLLLLRTVMSFEVQNMLSDHVKAGDVRFYTVESRDPVIIALVSDTGDADVYASPTSRNSHPSPYDYHYTSSSCGLDSMVLDMNKDQAKMTVGVYGHIRYEETVYRLYVISPSEEDIKRYQIWNWDPETNSIKLSIDVDLLHFSNDRALHRLLGDIEMGGVGHGLKEAKLDKGTQTFDFVIKIIELTVIVVGVVFKVIELSRR